MTLPYPPNNAVMNLPRRDAKDKLLGRTRYTVDDGGHGTLHAAARRSEVASGRIVKIDVTPALSMPGVKAIATHEDAPGLHGIGIADHPLFAKDVVRYHGEPLAVVAATTVAQARAAAAAILVEIDPIAPVLTMAEALAKDAPLIHPDWATYEILREGAARGGNVAWEATVVRGDTDAAFARDDVTIVEGTYRVGRQSHVPFEPRAVVASYDDGRFHIHTSTQVPWTVRHVTAKVLGVPEAAVHVTVPAVGGGFGLKFDCSLEPFAAILARKTGRKVSLVNSRREEQMTCLSRENADILIRSAVTPEGDIVGREATVLMDCGAYGGEQVFLTTMTAHTLGGNYRLGSVKIASQAVYTNTPPNGAFRACNGVYNTFALECHTDEICKAIGMDPLTFRRRNVVGHGDIGATGQVFEGDVLRPMLDLAIDTYGPHERDHRWHMVHFCRPFKRHGPSQRRWQRHFGHLWRRNRVGHDGAILATNRGGQSGHSPGCGHRQNRGYGCLRARSGRGRRAHDGVDRRGQPRGLRRGPVQTFGGRQPNVANTAG